MTTLDTEFSDSLQRAVDLQAEIDATQAQITHNERLLAALGSGSWPIALDSCAHCHGRRLRHVLDHALHRWHIEPCQECWT